MSEMEKAFLIVPPFVCFVMVLTFSVGYLVVALLGFPSSFGFPFLLRVFGWLMIFIGIVFVGWVFKYRKLKDVVISTYITLLTAVKKKPLRREMRREPLVIQGPYKYTRNPMYFGIILLWIGLWLALDYTSLLVSSIFIFLVFYFIIIPLEEKELKTLFGKQYEEYAEKVHKLIPIFHIKKLPEILNPPRPLNKKIKHPFFQ